ncbi:hypothetical protein DFH07DRAFT_943409 [Mycena maculata]|uniref:Uncharacterized protein n=1 Tax=Mycena maculata TaxID=230809 RepID=A0AAD7N1S9_9AGAR|nr:hypothetical protein DFH07DRAFT_943409 [Mycena maculata]
MADAKGKGKAREDPQCDDPQNPQLIRITNHGKISTWVTFALDFLEKHENIPIVLHTLPAPSRPTPSSQNPDRAGLAQPAVNPPSFSHTASTVPRLISVVEIIKREYVKKLELKHSSILTGLHQYNEIGTLEGLGLMPDPEVPQDAESIRSQEIVAALQGKTNLKVKQTPFMKITLSRTELTDLATATYQPPSLRKLSKSAKARAKRRENKAVDTTDAH